MTMPKKRDIKDLGSVEKFAPVGGGLIYEGDVPVVQEFPEGPDQDCVRVGETVLRCAKEMRSAWASIHYSFEFKKFSGYGLLLVSLILEEMGNKLIKSKVGLEFIGIEEICGMLYWLSRAASKSCTSQPKNEVHAHSTYVIARVVVALDDLEYSLYSKAGLDSAKLARYKYRGVGISF